MRVRRVPSPPARTADPVEEDNPTELLEVKIEPEVWFEQLPGSPLRPQNEHEMLQLGEQPGQPMAVIPDRSCLPERPSFGGRGTVNAAAAAGGAVGSGMDSDGDASMPDPDQFLETELASGRSEAAVDEDLTSLSWLQDRNLLKGIQLRPAPEPVTPPVQKQEPTSEPEEQSPTSDYLEEGAEDSPPSTGVGATEHFNARRYLDHSSYSYDPKLHSRFKPPFSFSCLIFMAIEDSICKALPVREIYGWIEGHFPFYKTAAVGWKNSVRHNLSLNKCFKRVDRTPYKPWLMTRSKGSFWTVEPHYRASLIQTLHRSPRYAHPWRYGGQNRLKLARTKGPLHNSHGRRRGRGPDDEDGDSEGGPNPQLFPFLAARLMSGPGQSSPQGSAADPPADPADSPECRVLTPQNIGTAYGTPKTYLRMREGQFTDFPSKRGNENRLPCFQRVMMISRSAAEDHTYAFSPVALKRRSRGRGGGGGDSEDEAFSDDSNLSHEFRGGRGYPRTSSGRSGDLTPEEVEGADLLLNLAGVSRAGSRVQSPQPAPDPAPAKIPTKTPAKTPRRRPGRPRTKAR